DGRLLRQVVSNATDHIPVLIRTGELAHVTLRKRVRCAIRIAFECYRRDADRWQLRKPCFNSRQGWIARYKPESPAVVVDHDGNVIWILEGARTPVEGGIVESPSWGCESPYQTGKFSAIVRVADAPALGGEVE